MIHKISAEIGPSTATHKTMSFYLAHQATYHGQVKIGAPLTVAIEQPAIDGRGIMRFAHGSTIDGRFENGAPVPYSFKYFSGDFDGAGDTQMIYSGH